MSEPGSMPVMYRQCAGMDVHKDSVYVCARLVSGEGTMREEFETFGTTTRELLRLRGWLEERRIVQVTMEATGVYWKPVWNLLEDAFDLWLVNARHVKQVPGRKTDMLDCQWLAQLLSCGLLKKSFVPPVEQRDLRDLTRGRTTLIQDRARVANRIQKVLEDANIKLGSVASDVLGASGRDMLAALVSGETDAAAMAQLARRRMRAKLPALTEALQGQVRDHHRFLLKSLLQQIDALEALIEAHSLRIHEVMDPFFKEAVARLDTMPGVDKVAAQCIVAEIGIDMSRFPTAGHLCSWAGLCPGNRRSAGKRQSGRMNRANVWLKAILCQTGWGASHTKDTYLSTQYHRLARRRGKKRALMAVGHSQLQSAYYMLRDRVAYAELGVNWLELRHGEQQAKHLVQRLEKLGYQVDIQKASAAA